MKPSQSEPQVSNVLKLDGSHLVAGRPQHVDDHDDGFSGVDPSDGAHGTLSYGDASNAMIDEAASTAAAAFPIIAALSAGQIATLLEALASQLETATDIAIATANRETALGETRLASELKRTTGQLRLFAEVVGAGQHFDPIIDLAAPGGERPHPDLRRIMIPIGPVAVFSASNFPLAFSVLGGDTASALAAGCPVVVKAHPSHPETSELVGRIATQALVYAGAPNGTFSLLHGRSPEVSLALVAHPAIKAVGFTGSHVAGMALYRHAAQRDDPIPVYAEMGSVNPVFATSRALETRGAEVARRYSESATLGNGQFCTKPGLAFIPPGEGGDDFVETVEQLLGNPTPQPMLNAGMVAGLRDQVDQTSRLPGVRVLAGDIGINPHSAGSMALTTDLDTWLTEDQLREEHFGPVTLIVRCPDDRMAEAAAALPGSLTASLHFEETDEPHIAPLVTALAARSGRVVFNGFPTGVAVTHAMHHGGPFPATTSPHFTSVGSTAMRRFQRPVCFQNAPDALLPDALKDANPLGIGRLEDGRQQHTDPGGVK